MTFTCGQTWLPALGSWLQTHLLPSLIAAATALLIAKLSFVFYAWLDHPNRLHQLAKYIPALKKLAPDHRSERLWLIYAAARKRERQTSTASIMVASIFAGFITGWIAVEILASFCDALFRAFRMSLRVPDAYVYLIIPAWICLTLLFAHAVTLLRLYKWTREVDDQVNASASNFPCRNCRYDLTAQPDELLKLVTARNPAVHDLPHAKLCTCPECGTTNVWWRRRSSFDPPPAAQTEGTAKAPSGTPSTSPN